MIYVLAGIGVLFCVGLAMTGYLVPLIIGGVIGSFFGLAGFGGAIAATIPGAIVGALVAIALQQKKAEQVRFPVSAQELGQFATAALQMIGSALLALIKIVMVAGFIFMIAKDVLLREATQPDAPATPQTATPAAPMTRNESTFGGLPVAPRSQSYPPAAPASADDYDRQLAIYERQYPEINPNSPQFDQQRTDGIGTRVNLYVAQGLSNVNALRAAIKDTYGD